VDSPHLWQIVKLLILKNTIVGSTVLMKPLAHNREVVVGNPILLLIPVIFPIVFILLLLLLLLLFLLLHLFLLLPLIVKKLILKNTIVGSTVLIAPSA
jgi:hypothetical protein